MSVRKLAALVAAVCTVLLLAPMTAGAQAPQAATSATSLQKIAVSGTARNGKKFTGQFSVQRFVTRGGKPYAVGALTGKVGHRSVSRRSVAVPVAVGQGGQVSSAAACPILHLVLGPVDLNLLGLKVHLDQVVLDITAQSGPGNLLGNLLCSVANLLNQQGLPVTQVVALLNVLNELLNNLGLLSL
jgi:hypothetical protein